MQYEASFYQRKIYSGVGMDALYNFINDKATNFLGKNNKLSVGLFGGFALAGISWLFLTSEFDHDEWH